MIKLAIFFLSITVSFSAFSEYTERDRLLKPENPNDLNPQRLTEDSEIYLFSDSLIRDTDEDLGILGDYYYTGKDKNRLSFSVHFSSDYSDVGKVSTISGQYLSKLDNYKQLWWGFQIKRTTAKYSALADEIQSTSGHSDSDSITVHGEDDQSMTILGLQLHQL